MYNTQVVSQILLHITGPATLHVCLVCLCMMTTYLVVGGEYIGYGAYILGTQ